MAIPPAQHGHRFLELDSVRGLAALAVILSHFNLALARRNASTDVLFHLLGSGNSAVVFFFLLSGFVLAGMYLGVSRPTYLSFLSKRVCRIYLPYVAAILLAAACAASLYSTVPVGNFWIDQTWNSPFSSKLLIQHLIMIGHFDTTQLNTAIWSLIVEMRVSLAFPVIAWIAAKSKPLLSVLLFAPITVVLAWFEERHGHTGILNTIFYSMIFISGAMLRHHYDSLRRRLLALSNGQTLSLLICGLIGYQFGEFVSFAHLGSSKHLDGFLSEWTICASAAVLLLLSTTFPALRNLLHSRVIMWAGTRSYSIYLLHGTVLFSIIRLVGGRGISIAYLPVFVIVTLLLSEAMFRWVETPTILLGRRLGKETVPNSLMLLAK